MAVALYLDVHVPSAVAVQLRRRGIDVLTAIEDGWHARPDDELLEHAHELQRVLFTQDIRFRALAEDWQQEQRPFSGLVFGHQLRGTIGQYVEDLELIAKASELIAWNSCRFETSPCLQRRRAIHQGTPHEGKANSRRQVRRERIQRIPPPNRSHPDRHCGRVVGV